MSNFQVKHEVRVVFDGGWKICLQYGVFDDDTHHPGYRFIWRDADDVTMPYKGQSKLPSLSVVKILIEKADREGWGKEYDTSFLVNSVIL